MARTGVLDQCPLPLLRPIRPPLQSSGQNTVSRSTSGASATRSPDWTRGEGSTGFWWFHAALPSPRPEERLTVLDPLKVVELGRFPRWLRILKRGEWGPLGGVFGISHCNLPSV